MECVKTCDIGKSVLTINNKIVIMGLESLCVMNCAMVKCINNC